MDFHFILLIQCTAIGFLFYTNPQKLWRSYMLITEDEKAELSVL
jgi:hypothetical protein